MCSRTRIALLLTLSAHSSKSSKAVSHLIHKRSKTINRCKWIASWANMCPFKVNLTIHRMRTSGVNHFQAKTRLGTFSKAYSSMLKIYSARLIGRVWIRVKLVALVALATSFRNCSSNSMWKCYRMKESCNSTRSLLR